MLVPNESISMAEWWFEYDTGRCIGFKNRSQIYNFLLRCQTVYNILAEAELLYITDIQYQHWVKYDVNTDKAIYKIPRKEGVKPLASSYLKPSRFADVCLEDIEDDPFIYPGDILFTGWGVIINESGEKIKRRSLVKMKVSSDGYPTVEISTYSDVWLPYDIYGKPQPKRHELNAPRLEKALTKVKEALGIDSMFDGNHLVEQDKEFTLTNCRDSLGDVLIYDPNLYRVV